MTSPSMRSLMTLVEAAIDHRSADGEQKFRVAERYRDALMRMKKLRTTVANDPVLRDSDFVKTLQMKIQNEIDRMRPYIRSLNHFRNTQENEEIEYLFSEGLEEIRFWFEGWKMHVTDDIKLSDVERAFRATQSLFPNPDMILYRVVAVEDARAVIGLREMITGPRSLQSWTLDINTARWFYKKQYAGGETLGVDDDGHLFYADKTLQHDWVIVEAKIPGNMILWTPSTYERLFKYDMHVQDLKLYGQNSRIPDNVGRVLDNFSKEREAIVYIPGNRPVPIRRVVPLHIRANVEN